MVESDKWFYIYLQHKLDYMCMVKEKGQIDKKIEGEEEKFREGWKIYEIFIFSPV